MAAHNARHPPGWSPPGYAPADQQSLIDLSRLSNLSSTQITILVSVLTLFLLTNLSFFRLSKILYRPKPPPSPNKQPAHLLIVLGSGGHTAEMLTLLPTINISSFTHRTYVVSSGDNFSASKAIEYESSLTPTTTTTTPNYEIITIRRARAVHQSIFTTPYTTLLCFWDCLSLFSPNPPDLILTNGPGTGVCVVLAAITRLFFYGSDKTKMRSIFIESWARVKSLSLSGRILKPFVDRFIVQWPDLVKVEGSRVEYIGHLIR